MFSKPKSSLASDYKCPKCDSTYVVGCVFIGDLIQTLHCINCNEVFDS